MISIIKRPKCKGDKIKKLVCTKPEKPDFISGSDRVYGRDWSRYLYFHNPLKYPLPCLFHVITGLYCRDVEQESELQYPAWKFSDCFLLQSGHGFLLPFLGIYFVTVAADWALTGKNHVDKRSILKYL